MTTIAYKDGVVAFDSYCTSGDMVVDANKNKSYRQNGVTFVFAGDVKNEPDLVAAWFGENKELEADTQAFVITGPDIYHVGFDANGEFLSEKITEPCWAIGSGQRFALGAMDAGCSAVEAVKIACNRDVYSGGRVRKIKV